MKLNFPFIFIVAIFFLIFSEKSLANDSLKIKNAQIWAENTLKSMTLAEKIGQLYMIPAYSNQSESNYKQIDNLINKYKVGGVIFFQGTAKEQATLTNRYQKLAKIPLMIGIDAEWGLGMRLEGCMNFPKNMMLGATNDPVLMEEFGTELGKQCKRLGIHINFAPVVDLNSNPKNPVIGVRSLGENKYRVSLLAAAFARGMQNEGVLACAKHFPGHGDTSSDSHYTLPTIQKTAAQIYSNELYPFKQLAKDKVSAVMVAHLQIPSLDNTANTPTTLSQKVIKGILLDSLHFEGLVFTDAMNMHALSDNQKAGEVDVKALLAGNDVLLFPMNLEKGILAIEQAVKEGKMTEEFINAKVRKILLAKYQVGLSKYKMIDLTNLDKDLQASSALVLREKMYAKAVTIVKNECQLLPFKDIAKTQFASLVIGAKKDNEFQKMLSRYARFDHYSAEKNQDFTALIEKLKKKSVVVIGLFGITEKAVSENYGISQETIKFIKKLQDQTKVVVVAFGNPYAMKFFEESDYLVCAHVANVEAQKAVPQVLFGAISTKARLPITASEGLPEGLGFDIAAMNRLKFSDFPEAAGLNSSKMAVIENMVEEAIKNRYMPGCQVLIARKGTVVMNKGFGNYTYEGNKPVTDETIYDLASLTKVLATVPAMMRLYEEQNMDLNHKISAYLPDLCDTDKEHISIKQAMAHQSPLHPYLPLFLQTAAIDANDVFFNGNQIGYAEENTESEEEIEKKRYESAQLSEKLIWNWVLKTPLRAGNKSGNHAYLYSDMPFFVLKKMAEFGLGKNLDYFVEEELRKPLGMNSFGYNPLKRIAQENIAPTSYDRFLRKNITWGEVNDNAAALTGGVGGHAGLFSNAMDIAIFSQMLVQKGNYGGIQFFEENTVKTFTKRQFPQSRRGAGWDKAIPGNLQPAGKLSPFETFGHRGFTGTCFWIDPVNEIIFIFLCNRVYPTANNWKLNKSGLREQINDIIHTAVMK